MTIILSALLLVVFVLIGTCYFLYKKIKYLELQVTETATAVTSEQQIRFTEVAVLKEHNLIMASILSEAFDEIGKVALNKGQVIVDGNLVGQDNVLEQLHSALYTHCKAIKDLMRVMK